MKHTLFLLAATMLLTFSCRHGNSQAQTTDNPQELTFTITSKDGVTLLVKDGKPLIFGLVDKENEMSKELFLGSYDDNLLAELMPDGASRSAINAFIVMDSSNTILFDAGLGADNGGLLLESMKKAEIEPAKVTAVCLTHLHFDHIGGLLHGGQATFPNATLYLSQEEYDAWGDGGPLAKNNGMWKQVMEAYKGHIKTFSDGEKLFDGLVVAELAPGHTPGHTVYTVDGFASSPAICCTPKTFNWIIRSFAPATTRIPSRPLPRAHASSRVSVTMGNTLRVPTATSISSTFVTAARNSESVQFTTPLLSLSFPISWRFENNDGKFPHRRAVGVRCWTVDKVHRRR